MKKPNLIADAEVWSGEEESPTGLCRERMPKHVAVIMDGNRRWAKTKGLEPWSGHEESSHSHNLKCLVFLCCKWGIKVLTLYAFSTENWVRPKDEVDHLRRLFDIVYRRDLKDFIRDEIRVSIIGDTTKLSIKQQIMITTAEKATKNHTRLHVIVAINYGGREDIMQACQSISRKVKDNILKPEDINENLMNQELHTKCTEFPYPDLLIRTSGEQRISNFLMWQLAYTEIYFEECLWPDFGEKEFVKALRWFQERRRRYGGQDEEDNSKVETQTCQETKFKMARSLKHTFDFCGFLRKLDTSHVEIQIPTEPHWAFCYNVLKEVSDSFVHLFLLVPELRNVVCVCFLILKALDTVADDMNIPSDVKVPIMENFYRHIYDGDLHISCGTNHHKVLIDRFYHVSTALLELPKGYQETIEETTKIIGAGKAKFILNEVETVDDYTEYCHIVLGLVYVETSKIFHSSGLMDSVPDHLSNSMGLVLQKVHIILEFMEDMNEIQKARIYWPRQIWSRYVDKLEDLTYKENSDKAVCCLNDMVTDALLHAEHCLEYMSALRDPTIFQLCAIGQTIAFGTLALSYNNIEIFKGGVKMRHALSASIIEGTKSMSDVYGAFYDFSSMLKTKIDNNDPNTTNTLSRVEAIQQVCVDSGLLKHRTLYLELVVEGKLYQVTQGRSSSMKELVDPFSLVADELSLIGNRLREMVVSEEVPKLASAAQYFFEMGVEGKRFRPTVLLLMASSLSESIRGVVTNFSNDLLTRQQRIAEITEMIHVASLLHDDVLDDADTRRGVHSLNIVVGNNLSVLAGDFLLCRAMVALASLENTEVVTLFGTTMEHLVTGEIMQMTSTSEKRCSMDQYMRKTYCKTASLIANSCKAIAILAGQETEVAMLAYDYGRNLGLAYQLIDDVLDFTGTSASLGKGSLSDIRHGIITAPILFAIEEFQELQEVINRGFNNPEDIDLSLEYLGKSCGIQKAIELAKEHANLAASAINSLPQSDDDKVRISRQALVDLTQIVITRTK